MTANVDAMVRAGVEAYRAGNKLEARTFLERAIELDQYNETAWLWLSAVVETQDDQKTCLENVLVINPQNERARQGLRSMGIDPDTLLNASSASPAFTDDTTNDWNTSASDTTAQEPSSDYDSWMSNLSTQNSTTGESSSPTTASAFADDAFADDAFADDAFASESFDANAAFEFNDDLFEEDDVIEDDYAYDSDDEYAYDDEGYYDDQGYYEDDSGYDEGTYDESYEDDAYSQSESIYDDADFYADEESLANFESSMESGMYDHDNLDEFSGDPFDVPEEEPEPTAQALLEQIPPEIPPTRLPGKDEQAPASAAVVTWALAIANVAALLVFLFRFFV